MRRLKSSMSVNCMRSLLNKVPIIETARGWNLPTALRVPSAMHEVIKRILDIFFVLLTLPVTLPLIGLAALCINSPHRGRSFLCRSASGGMASHFA